MEEDADDCYYAQDAVGATDSSPGDEELAYGYFGQDESGMMTIPWLPEVQPMSLNLACEEDGDRVFVALEQKKVPVPKVTVRKRNPAIAQAQHIAWQKSRDRIVRHALDQYAEETVKMIKEVERRKNVLQHHEERLSRERNMGDNLFKHYQSKTY